ncbi:hypothetical protein CDAR_392661 [Caerostris darwini]|uniref:Uncharacterized protein n=1 Tax=Caerostris darwini TaxID=1538125 RepID=A0AAV4PKC3_9ARAC|nr:hypothetical protein CDAR_392661 [Caerostris darwini]
MNPQDISHNFKTDGKEMLNTSSCPTEIRNRDPQDKCGRERERERDREFANHQRRHQMVGFSRFWKQSLQHGSRICSILYESFFETESSCTNPYPNLNRPVP